VYELLGGLGPERVPVYDGAFYFTDLRPLFRENWVAEFGREVERSLAMGHRAMKIKVGRGKLWMRADEGLMRDVEVIRLFRRLAGNDVYLAADANDGYDPERTRRFVEETADCRLGLIEEPFPESVEEYLRLKEFLREQELEMKIADGENIRRPAEIKGWVDAKAVDVLQGDMNLYGFEDILAEAAMAAGGGASVAPHNWGSLLGYYLQLHVGKAIPNFFMAEQDPLSCKALIAEGYEIRDGRSSVPAAPGLGLRLDETTLRDVACVHFDLKP
jgi:L-alanine-DL-glutamate epimerase-like enolase superfamily enzyme